MSYNDYFSISDNDYNMFTESSITGRYDYMDITEATQKFQIDIIDMLHEFTENVWITEATNVANGRRPYALFEAEGFWEKVKDMFRKAIAWIKDMYIKVKGWLLDKWEDAKKWWKTMGMSESDVKLGCDIYTTKVYGKTDSKIVPSDSAYENDAIKDSNIGTKDNKSGGLDVKIKNVKKDVLEKIENLIRRVPTQTNKLTSFLAKFVQTYGRNMWASEKTTGYELQNLGSMKSMVGSSLDDFFKKEIYADQDSEKYIVITPTMLSDAIFVVFKQRNNFISSIMKHERACTKTLENTLRQAQRYQSGDTEYKNSNDDVLADYDSDEYDEDTTKAYNNGITQIDYKLDSSGKRVKSKMSVDILSAQIRFNSDVVKKAIEAYRRLLSNSISIIKRVMSNERMKKTIKAIKNGDRETSAYKNITESYNDYWDNNDYSGRMESYMWS